MFFDVRLSKDETVSCATCHDPELAFTDGKPVSEGIRGLTGTRSAPTILNAMFSSTQFWDGRVDSLEAQAKLPLINPVEMGMDSHETVVEKVKGLSDYQDLFDKVFNGEVTIDHVADAIAAFERMQVSGDSPFDEFVQGNESAISQSAQRGWELFRGKAMCQTCHIFVRNSSPFFTDFQFHNIGVGSRKVKNFDDVAKHITDLYQNKTVTDEQLDTLALTANDLTELGRFNVTRQPKDLGAFKTPTLRDVELTAPYMHDGSLSTLQEVVVFYNKGGHDNAHLDSRMHALGLTNRDVQDLVVFMKTLTSDRVRSLSKNTVLTQ